MFASSIISIPDQIVIKELNIDNEMAIIGNEDIDISISVTVHGNNRFSILTAISYQKE